jgi:hypothetical protein
MTDDDEYEDVGGIIGRGKPKYSEKEPAALSLCPPQIPPYLTRIEAVSPW